MNLFDMEFDIWGMMNAMTRMNGVDEPGDRWLTFVGEVSEQEHEILEMFPDLERKDWEHVKTLGILSPNSLRGPNFDIPIIPVKYIIDRDYWNTFRIANPIVRIKPAVPTKRPGNHTKPDIEILKLEQIENETEPN